MEGATPILQRDPVPRGNNIGRTPETRPRPALSGATPARLQAIDVAHHRHREHHAVVHFSFSLPIIPQYCTLLVSTDDLNKVAALSSTRTRLSTVFCHFL